MAVLRDVRGILMNYYRWIWEEINKDKERDKEKIEYP